MNHAELSATRDECYSLVTAYASSSGVAGLSPLPGVDVAADLALLLNLIPKINKRFHLTPDQIGASPTYQKEILYRAISEIGSKLAGQCITRELIIQIAKSFGLRLTTKQACKWLPLIGYVISSGISYTIMKYIGNAHVNDCYQIRLRITEKKFNNI